MADPCTGLPDNIRTKFRSKNGWLPVKDTKAAPYRYVCSVNSFYDSEYAPLGSMSGVLIGDRLVLTAAHVVWPQKDLIAKEVYVIPGLKKGFMPFGSASATKLIIWPKYKPPKLTSKGKLGYSTVDFENDLALIVTREKIGQAHEYEPDQPGAGYWGKGVMPFDSQGTTIGALPGWRPGHFNANICGYPNVKRDRTPWYSFDSTLKGALEPGLMFVRNKLCHGHSGSPVWIKRSRSQGGRVLIGIFIGWKFINSNKAQACVRLINEEFLQFIYDIHRGKKVGKQITL